MPRSNNHQAITKDVNNLVIGTPQFRFKKIDGFNLTDATADAASSPLTISDSLGSLQSASLTADAQFKTHTSGYPALEDARILEENSVLSTVVSEELLNPTTLVILRDIFGQVAGRPANRYATEIRVEKYAGGGVSYYMGNAQVKPQLSISTQNDWIGAEFQFESLLKSSYTNQELCYRNNFTASARSRDNQAATRDADTLCIGYAQVRMGPATPRGTATQSIGSPRFFSGYNSSTTAAGLSESGTYTGSVSTAVVVKITDTNNQRLSNAATVASPGSNPTFDTSTGTGDNTLVFEVDGTDTYTVTFTDSATNGIDTVISEINAAGAGTPASIVQDPLNQEYKVLITGATSIEFTTANTSLGFASDGGSPPSASTFSWWDEEGNSTTGVAVTGASQSLADGVSVTFSSTTAHSPGDTWAIPVVSPSAKSSDPAASQVNSNYPFLKAADSIGAVQAVTLTLDATLKEHFSGYPQKKDAEILEESTVTIDVGMEEFDYDGSALTTGSAVTLADMLFDSSVNGARYHAPFEMVTEGITGDILSLWLANAEIVGNLEVSPSDDWAQVPFQAAGQVQSPDHFHASATVPDIITLHTEDLV